MPLRFFIACTLGTGDARQALALAVIVGVFLGGMTADALLAGFPTSLLVTRIGITLLFSIERPFAVENDDVIQRLLDAKIDRWIAAKKAG